MSPVGHTFIGLSFATVALPDVESKATKAAAACVFVALANLPDWPLPNWGHDRYDISHSVFVNMALIVVSCVLLKKLLTVKLLTLGSAAWLSHLLLDSFYNHGNGVAIYWPFSKGRLNFSMPWFNNIDLAQSPVSAHNLSVFLAELIAYGPILLIAWGVTRIKRKSTL